MERDDVMERVRSEGDDVPIVLEGDVDRVTSDVDEIQHGWKQRGQRNQESVPHDRRTTLRTIRQ
jgi:hypothetical protein